jgi:hypothetical protein
MTTNAVAEIIRQLFGQRHYCFLRHPHATPQARDLCDRHDLKQR